MSRKTYGIMAPTQLLDTLRTVRREFVAFLSIVMIGMLAALAFLGISESAAALRRDEVRFFNENGMWDGEIVSNLLLTEEDLAAVRAMPGVGDVERVWQLDTELRAGEDSYAVTVMSLPSRISRPVLTEGRLPERPTECAVEKKLAETCSLAVGQSLRLDGGKIMDVEPLAGEDYEITGIFITPDHISDMVSPTPYVLLPEDSFNREGLDGAFMRLRLRVDGAPEDRFSQEYWDAMRPVTDGLRDLGDEREPLRQAEVRGALEEQIAAGEQQLEEKREELLRFRETLQEEEQKLADAELRLAQMAGLLDAAEGQLNRGGEQLQAVLDRMEEQGFRFREGAPLHEKLETVLDRLGSADAFVRWAEADGALPEEALELYHEYAGEFQNMTVIQALSRLEDMVGGSEEVAEVRTQIEALQQGIGLYLMGRNEYYYAGEQYLDALTGLRNGRKKLQEGSQSLEEAEQQLRDGEAELDSARQRLDQIRDCHWVVLDNYDNPGFVYSLESAGRLSSLSLSFSAIFLVVGTLVIYATVSRMVTEQRRLIGMNRALGLLRREIAAKYLLFACAAALLGSGLGALLAWGPMQSAILDAYGAYLNGGRGERAFLPLETGAVVGGALVLSGLAVVLACRRLLRFSAMQLMQGTPPAAKRKRSRRSAGRSLYSRLILRNMAGDRIRILVTVVSIAGGCALMVIGFTIRFGMSRIPERQFEEIQTYDAEVFFAPDDRSQTADEIAAILEKEGVAYTLLSKRDGVFDDDDSFDPMTMIVAEPGALDGFFVLRDADGGQVLDLPDSGVLVPNRFRECFGVPVGGNAWIYDDGMTPRACRVAGVFENYFGQTFFMSPRAYAEVFGAAPENNCFFVRSGALSLDGLQKALEGVDGFLRVDDAAAGRETIERFTASLNFVEVLMLFIAGLMDGFILMNFTLTFILQKTEELTVMRVNGFTFRECVRYMATDLAITTALGTLLGLLAGGGLGAVILRMTETQHIQMVREPKFETFLYSALITLVFSLLTNSVALRRIRRLKLTDLGRS